MRMESPAARAAFVELRQPTFEARTGTAFADALDGAGPNGDPDEAPWPPAGSSPYTGMTLYYPDGRTIPTSSLAVMQDGRVFYQVTGKETLGAMVSVASQLQPSGMRSRERFLALNNLPYVMDDNAPVQKAGTAILLRGPAQKFDPPKPSTATGTSDAPIVQYKEAAVDHDNYYRQQIDMQVKANEMNAAKSQPSPPPRPDRMTNPPVDHDNIYREESEKQLVATAMDITKKNAAITVDSPFMVDWANDVLAEKFGKPYVDEMIALSQAEHLQAMLERQGTIDRPYEERLAEKRAQYFHDLDETYGAFSPVVKFFLPAGVTQELGMAPSPIEILTDIGSGLHFSRGGAGPVGQRSGPSLSLYHTPAKTSYFVTEPARVTTVKPQNTGGYFEIRSTNGQALWLPKSSIAMPTEQANKAIEWVRPAIEASKTTAPKTTAPKTTATISTKMSEVVPGASNPVTKQGAAKSTSPARQPATETVREQPKVAVQTAEGTVKEIDAPTKTNGNKLPGGGTNPNIGDVTTPKLNNALQPGDPALVPIERLRKQLETSGNGARLYGKEDGTGINRSMQEPDKVIFSTNKPLEPKQIKEAFQADVPVEVRQTGRDFTYLVTIPHPNRKTGAQGGGAREVDPKRELYTMAEEPVAFNMENVSQSRGRVRDPVNAENAMTEQATTRGVEPFHYHENFAKARSAGANKLAEARAKGNPFFETPEEMGKTLDDMHRTQMSGELYANTAAGEMRRPDRLRFGPAPLSHLVDVETAAKKYGEPFRLIESYTASQNVFESSTKLRMTPAITPEMWAKYNPTLKYDEKMVNPWHNDGAGWQYAGTKTAKAGDPAFANQLVYEKAVVETYQKIAWEKGRSAMQTLEQRNALNPAENAERFRQLDTEMLKQLGEHTYYLMNARKYDNANASIYMNEVNMLLRMSGYNEVPHGVLDHAAYRFAPQNFSNYFVDWVRTNN